MAFTDEQQQALKAKLRYRHVKTRANHGASISYVEGWHAIAEANRIFGYDCWDRQTLSPRCLWRETQRGETTCFYSTKVRITVRAGESAIVREGVGTGTGRSATPEMAHEIALKAAETDATKRALATFGNPFGLALYDKEQRGVTKRPKIVAPAIEPAPQAKSPFQLCTSGHVDTFQDSAAFVAAVTRAAAALPSVETVVAFWEANLDSFALLPRATNGDDPVRVIGSALKNRVHALGQTHEQPAASVESQPESEEVPGQLLIPKEKRIRDKAHLAFVASQPCLVCGRKPAQAHHIRFAQPRGLGLKVSDEFTVPLCNGHHDSLHHTGDERAWWTRHGILDPLQIANRLWAASRGKTGEGMPTVANGQSQSEVSTGTAAEEPPW